MIRCQCPCCGYYTLPEHGGYDICPICKWEDDVSQFYYPEMGGGANNVSLNEARRNYKENGVSDPKHIKEIRAPLLEELPENNVGASSLENYAKKVNALYMNKDDSAEDHPNNA